MKLEAKTRLQAATALTKDQRINMASEIIEKMREAYARDGEEGDFEDGERHLRDDASDTELRQEYKKYCGKTI